jgi:hypothetical protein
MSREKKAELPDSKTIILRQPVVVGDQSYDSLDLREPTAGDFEKMTKLSASNPAGALLQLIADVSGVALPIIKKIGVRDMNEAGEYLMGFIQSGPQTTSSSSPD